MFIRRLSATAALCLAPAVLFGCTLNVTKQPSQREALHLASSGRLLEHFEGRLRQKLGPGPLCGTFDYRLERYDLTRYADSPGHCVPLSKHFVYSYVFSDPTPGRLSLYGGRARSTDYANAFFVTVNGKYVRCTRDPLRLAMKVNNDPDFTLSCVEHN